MLSLGSAPWEGDSADTAPGPKAWDTALGTVGKHRLASCAPLGVSSFSVSDVRLCGTTHVDFSGHLPWVVQC